MKQLQIIFFLFLSLFISNVVIGQYRSEKMRTAENLEYQQKYFEAIDLYEEVIEENATLHEVMFKLATTYEKYGALNEAQKWYQKLADDHEKDYPTVNFELAKILKKKEQYGEAKILFEKFIKSYSEFDRVEMNKIVKNEIEGCELAMKSVTDTSYSYRALFEVNSIYTDLAPIVKDEKFYFSTIKSDSVLRYTDEEGQTNFMELWTSNFNEKTNSVEDSLVKFGLPTWYKEGENMGGGSFSVDGLRFYFSRCQIDLQRKNLCKIYGASKSDTGWSDAIEIKGDVNDVNNEYSSTHPTLSHYEKRNKKRDVLYFSSNRPDGKGGYDLWEIELDENFNAGKAKNLGNKINTILNEITPSFNEEEQVLYFSSDGHEGKGGYDIYSAAKNRSRFKNPEHLTAPFNSSLDDFFYFKIDEYKQLLVSNRKGAKKYYKNFVLDDIFLFTKEKPIEKYFYVSCFEKNNPTVALDSVSATIQYQLADKNKLTTNKFILAKIDTAFTINATKKGYFSSSRQLLISAASKDTTVVQMFLEKVEEEKEIRLKNIYFGFDSDVLTDSSKLELDSLLIILANNPLFKIEIGAHTDNKGRAQYNLNLSQKRAESVVEYLAEKGISKTRLIAKGYGMSKPIAANKNPDGSDNPEGRQLNRRIVFKIVGVIDKPKEETSIEPETVDSTQENYTVRVSEPDSVIQKVNVIETVDSNNINQIEPRDSAATKKQLLEKVTAVKVDAAIESDEAISTKEVVESEIEMPSTSKPEKEFISFPVNGSVIKDRYRWLKASAAQKIACTSSINLKQLRVLVKKKSGAKFKVVITRAKNGKTVFESNQFNYPANKSESARTIDSLDIDLNVALAPDVYFIYPVLESGEIAYLANYTNENDFNNGSVIVGAGMFTNFSSKPEKYKFKLKEENKGRMLNYGPFFKFVIEIKN